MPWRVTLAALAVGLLLVLGFVQAASESLSARAAALGTLPTRIPPSFGLRVYRVLDRVAPAPYVETTLAQQALDAGDYAAARAYALRLPASANRDELLARAAQSGGQDVLATEYFLAALDSDAVDAQAQYLARAEPAAAYGLEAQLAAMLSARGGHPDALARARWQMGLLANRTAWGKVPGSPDQRAWLARALMNFDAAVAIAPLSERYVIADANQADLLLQRARAGDLFARAARLDPGSADAVAGLGVIAYENGDRASAATLLARARALDPNSLMVRALERDLR